MGESPEKTLAITFVVFAFVYTTIYFACHYYCCSDRDRYGLHRMPDSIERYQQRLDALEQQAQRGETEDANVSRSSNASINGRARGSTNRTTDTHLGTYTSSA
ncbi:predicted protein [Chaetoceros tenuissimus]|uniref:Uncharacterized protein n=1 Tax=Chaetoceros tenuissimus TaxID=426638 RepID=A0AAD3D4C5_9STRA|nr:predicted protein [Chaetoceros tenuissimus]